MIEHIADGTLEQEILIIAERPLPSIRLDSDLHRNEVFVPVRFVIDWYPRQITYDTVLHAVRPEFLRYYEGRLWISVLALDLLNKLVQGENNHELV
jgi:hypothetical protein